MFAETSHYDYLCQVAQDEARVRYQAEQNQAKFEEELRKHESNQGFSGVVIEGECRVIEDESQLDGPENL